MSDLEALCSELLSGDDARAEIAAGQLAGYGADAIRKLRGLAEQTDPDVRWWAVRALAGMTSTTPEVVSDLIRFLEDASEDVRQAAAMGLCHHPDVRAIPALIARLFDEDAMTAKLASNALILTGSPAAPYLLEVLDKGTPRAKLEAVRALAEIKEPSTIPGLFKAIESDSALMQYWAGLGLENMGVGMTYLKPD